MSNAIKLMKKPVDLKLKTFIDSGANQGRISSEKGQHFCMKRSFQSYPPVLAAFFAITFQIKFLLIQGSPLRVFISHKIHPE